MLGLPRSLPSRARLATLLHFRGMAQSATGTAQVPGTNEVIMSGIQPTGIPHLGNYLGALSSWVKLQTSPASRIYTVVDLHALTIPRPAKQLRKGVRDMARAILACGVDPKHSTLFVQSAVPEHNELAWILSCQTSVHWLNRMTQWKSKMQINDPTRGKDHHSASASSLPPTTDTLKLGLYAYPVLQAADVLLYQTSLVPVGEDQRQHLELTRDIAESFNRLHDRPIFRLPEVLIPDAKRVMSLRDPSKKMSKSDPSVNASILLTDDGTTISRKIRRAVTDSAPGITFDPAARPGIANLLQIYAGVTGTAVEDVVRECASLTTAEFKDRVADVTISHLTPIRSEYERMEREGDVWLDQVFQAGAEKARHEAQQTLREVKKAIGLC
ncbi:tryptophanyl-tRNA synthetase [Piptocephalis cylindrospora]|uniref:Tryptophan--tRNA ligase, mitochondrial n=1 Tax=Piptocephalis cylindrospora TaxID=1907219 RepID=A0A4P9XZK4_9FUNG|nr:tryptophanyl-tRNA synthetase [Piptocephalis cylindrospora]|eukprot:RKP11875.1 tryptophanyl-tRNA synthetase [Piptocephalis cylindrospora]